MHVYDSFSLLFYRYNSADYPTEDCDRRARLQRALEIEQGVDPPPGFIASVNVTNAFNAPLFAQSGIATGPNPVNRTQAYIQTFMLPSFNIDGGPRIHSQVRYAYTEKKKYISEKLDQKLIFR